METKINYSEVPFGYPVCLNWECTQAATCLRQLVVLTIPADVHCWTIISPEYLASLKVDSTCQYYRPAVKIRLAKGFVDILQNLPYKQMQDVILYLKAYFSRRTYFRVRKGERLLSPAEQKQVLHILKDCGVPEPGEFDAYIEKYDW